MAWGPRPVIQVEDLADAHEKDKRKKPRIDTDEKPEATADQKEKYKTKEHANQ